MPTQKPSKYEETFQIPATMEELAQRLLRQPPAPADNKRKPTKQQAN